MTGGGVLAWLAAPAFLLPTVSGVAVVAITAAFKQTRRLWALVFRAPGRLFEWVVSFRFVHKSRVRPRRPEPIAPVRWVAAEGPGPNEVTLANAASGVARNVRVDNDYGTKVLDDAQWSEFPKRASFRCVVDRFQNYASLKVSWTDERGDPQPFATVPVERLF